MNKIFLEIDQETYKFLTELSKEMNTQDNMATPAPYGYIVVHDEYRYCPEEIADRVRYYDPMECEEYEEDQLYEKYTWYVEDALKEEHKEIFPFDDWLALKFREIPEKIVPDVCKHEYVNYFLTKKAFDQHMEEYKHNLPENSEPLIIINRQNQEMKRLQEFLRNLTLNKDETPRFDVKDKGENDE